jgi:hypothetical protein
MANILALVSKSGFKDIERQYGEIALGATCPITTYYSKNKRLAALADGGSPRRRSKRERC